MARVTSRYGKSSTALGSRTVSYTHLDVYKRQALVFDYICMRLLGKKKGERVDCNTVITAVIFTLCLSATTPYWVAIYGMLFAIVVAKFPFGGNGKNIFNPAAVGLAFCAISFPGYLFQYLSLIHI